MPRLMEIPVFTKAPVQAVTAGGKAAAPMIGNKTHVTRLNPDFVAMIEPRTDGKGGCGVLLANGVAIASPESADKISAMWEDCKNSGAKNDA